MVNSMNLFLCSSQHLEGVNNPSFCFYFLIQELSRGHTAQTPCLYIGCQLATAPYLHNSTHGVKGMLQDTLVLLFATTETRHQVLLQAVPWGYHNTMFSASNGDLNREIWTPDIIYRDWKCIKYMHRLP